MLFNLLSKYPDERNFISFLFKLFLIWLSWKGIIFVLGRESAPIEERFFPLISTRWEEFNYSVVRFLLYLSRNVLEVPGFLVHVNHRTIWIHGYNGLSIGNYCIGIQLMYYFAMMIIITPMSGRRKLIAVPLGIVITLALNVIRISSLCMVAAYYPGFMHYAHDHIFNVVVFGTLMVFYYYLVKEKKGQG